MAVLPLMFVSLRAWPSASVTVSDASEWGGGVCVATELSDEGRQATLAEEFQPRAVGRDKLVLVSLFDGIGGAHQALCLLGVEVAVSVNCEICDRAARVVQRAFSDAIRWRET